MVFKGNDFKFFIDENKLDNSYTQFENKIGLKVGSRLLREYRDVVLNFPYKDCVLEGGQSTEEGTDTYFEYNKESGNYDEKKARRKEIFFNQILAKDEIDRLFEPKAFANVRKYQKDENGSITESEAKEFTRDKNGDIKDNLIIKGNNLLALHSLKEQFRGKVKLIYIDPPYNTGNDSFAYNDNFNHSSWLVFMKNRLEIAKELLREDGSIWINIDDDESHYLKALGDSIFGRHNFIANVIWEKKYAPQNDSKYFSDNHDHILIFAKNSPSFSVNLLPRSEEMDNRYRNPDNDKRGVWTSDNLLVKTYSATYDYPIKNPVGRIINPPNGSCWRVSKEKFEELKTDNRIWFGEKGENVPRLKRFLSEVQQGSTPLTIWKHQEAGHNQDARRELFELVETNIFTTPKPEKLLYRIITIGSNEKDIILDFHIGSGTTAAVAHKMNRQFIGIEQMDYIENVTVERLKMVIEGEEGGISKTVNWHGGGSFIYLELAKNNQNALERIEAAGSYEELMTFFDEMYERYFLNYNVKIREFKEKVSQEPAFKNLPLERQKQIFGKMLDLNQLYVNRSDMEDSRFQLSENDITATHNFYGKNPTFL
ncbi:MAG: site-specific DNA-methyltransferase [Cytophagaceae bacterium]|nr:site-specific DNA-methyltransferase [Cytophagaceae bacterium]MBK9936514.1 site-specific DNA-methyltransferase [Cytophagaceae bacterium]MBL0327202.1 site-specific DNA-methyltransferase [Cytophagaceae bacterium]